MFKVAKKNKNHMFKVAKKNKNHIFKGGKKKIFKGGAASKLQSGADPIQLLLDPWMTIIPFTKRSSSALTATMQRPSLILSDIS